MSYPTSDERWAGVPIPVSHTPKILRADSPAVPELGFDNPGTTFYVSFDNGDRYYPADRNGTVAELREFWDRVSVTRRKADDTGSVFHIAFTERWILSTTRNYGWACEEVGPLVAEVAS